MIDTILEDVKSWLWITITDNDTKIKRGIRSALATIKNIVWCDDLFLYDDQWSMIQRKTQVNMCDLYTSCSPIYRLCLPVNDIVSIWWSPVDVCIEKNYIGIIQKWCSCSCVGCVEIIRTGWYETLPDDMMDIVIDTVQSVLCGSQTIKKYNYWDKTIEYCCDIDDNRKTKKIDALVKKYYKHFTYTKCQCH